MKKLIATTIILFTTYISYCQYNENENWYINKSHISDLDLEGKVKEIREYVVLDYNLYSEESIQDKYLSISAGSILQNTKEENPHLKRIKLNHKLSFDAKGLFVGYKNYLDELENYSVKYFYTNYLIDSTSNGNWTNKNFSQTKKADTTILSCVYGDYYFTNKRMLHKILNSQTKKVTKEITYNSDEKIEVIREWINDKNYATFFTYKNENKISAETYLKDELQNVKKFNEFGDITSVERHNHSTLNILNAKFFYKYDSNKNWVIKIERHNQRNHRITVRLIDYY